MSQKKDIPVPRRSFLRGLAVAPLILSLPAKGEDRAKPPVNRRVPILQVWADETSALIVVLGKAGWSFRSAANASLKLQVLKQKTFQGTDQILYHVEIHGLSVSAYDHFEIYEGAKKLESRSLKGLDLDAKSPALGVVSCANYRKDKDQVVMYAQMQKERPDLNLFIGDIVYSNSRSSTIFHKPEDPDKALERYLETWNALDFYQMEPLIPTVAVWDDHDYGSNNGDASRPQKAEMQAIFRSFYPLPARPARILTGPGVSFRLRAFGLDIYMMDDRSEFVPQSTQWGAEQQAWLAKDFNASQNPAWIINGTQYFKYFPIIESIQKRAPATLEWLKDLLRKGGKPAVLFSGDVHSSQVQELAPELFGFKTYEITSSGIHCNTAGKVLKRSPEEGQLFYYGENNFLIVHPSAHGNIMDLEIHCVTTTGKTAVANTPFRIAV
jgi:alkaline phosphatase D